MDSWASSSVRTQSLDATWRAPAGIGIERGRPGAPCRQHDAVAILDEHALQINMFWNRRYNQDEGNHWLRTLVAGHFAE